MTRTRKSNARSREQCSGEQPSEKPRAQEASARVGATTDELERRMRSALDDVYEVLLQAGGESEETAWAEFELVNDLTH